MVGLALVPPYTLYDAKSLSLLAVQVKTTWALPGVATRFVGVAGAVYSIMTKEPSVVSVAWTDA
mgnify:CR=1 FL=1